MIGLVVKHRNFGEGKIVAFDGAYLSIEFATGEKDLLYPESFAKGILSIKDDNARETIMQQALADMERKNAQIKELEEKKRAEEERLRAEREEQEMQMRAQNIKRARSSNVEIPRKNVAFKCTYCDGGATCDRVGFCGICSQNSMERNIRKEKHVWCSSGSKCRAYLDGEISYNELEQEFKNGELCYESVMLKVWKAGAGTIQNGVNKGKPLTLEQVQKNSLAVLTTRLPNSKTDRERVIFGVFMVDDAYSGGDNQSGYVTTKSQWKIELKPAEAKQMLFWNYYFCPKMPQKMVFGSGLHRYLSDEQSAQILKDIVEVKTDEKEKQFAQEFLEEYCKRVGLNVNSIPSRNGALIQFPV